MAELSIQQPRRVVNAAIHMATQELVEYFRVVTAGTDYPTRHPAAPAHLKVKLRRPFGLKLGSAAAVPDDETGWQVAQNFATLLQMPVEAQMVPCTELAWRTFEPERPDHG